MAINNEHYAIELTALINKFASIDRFEFKNYFPDIENRFHSLCGFLQKITTADLSENSSTFLRAFYEELDSLYGAYLSFLRRYQPRHLNEDDLEEVRTEFVGAFNSLYSRIIDKIEQVGKPDTSSLDEYKNRIEQLQAELETRTEDYNLQLDSLKRRMEDATEKAEKLPREIAEKNAFAVELTPHISYLRKTLYKNFHCSSYISLFFFFITFFILLYFLIGGYELVYLKISQITAHYPHVKCASPNGECLSFYDFSKFTLTSSIISKIGVVALLSYMLFFFGKNFSSFRHNQIVTEHRASSMEVYSSFVAHPDIEPETKDKITSYASDAIFSHQETGFLKADNAGNVSLTVPNMIGLSSGGTK